MHHKTHAKNLKTLEYVFKLIRHFTWILVFKNQTRLGILFKVALVYLSPANL
jgi:hypothetical protein